MKKNLSLIALVATTLIVSSCASNQSVEKKIDQEIKDVPASETKSIAQTVKDQINSSALTAEQKTKDTNPLCFIFLKRRRQYHE